MALRVAAAVVLVVGAGYFGSRVGEQRLGQTMAGRRSVIEVPAGQRISVTLQDGTCVCLNGGSRLEYPVLFAGEQRRVKLSGEALLEVAHDASCPFVVETFASEIEVLGTTFNVYADEAGRHFSTTLVEGCVQVRNLLSKNLEQHILSPDESVRLVDGHLEHHHVTAADALCWTQGYINIRGVGFDELMRRFENTYGVRIEIARETLPAIGYLSGKIQVSEGVDFALSLLQQACDFRYTKDPESGTITIL